MGYVAPGERAERVPIGAFVDREQRDELVRLAHERDCSMSRIVRRAIAAELERSEDPGVPSSIRPGPAECDGTSEGRREAVEPNASRGEKPKR
jgi:predicted transcriptional regulator